jgi:hypothetical protein
MVYHYNKRTINRSFSFSFIFSECNGTSNASFSIACYLHILFLRILNRLRMCIEVLQMVFLFWYIEGKTRKINNINNQRKMGNASCRWA